MTLHLNRANSNVQSLKGAKIFFCFPIISIFGSLASEICIISCYYTPDRRTFFKSLRGAQKSRVLFYVRRHGHNEVGSHEGFRAKEASALISHV